MANFYINRDDSVDATDYFLKGLRDRQLYMLRIKSFMDEFVPAKLPKITKVVANEKNGYTIVKFSNDYVSKVKCNNEAFDLEKAVAMAIAKYLIGNNGFYKALENATVIKKEEK